MSAKTKQTQFNVTALNPNADVYVTVTIGNAQIGGTRVSWTNDGIILRKGSITSLNLGPGSGCTGKTLELYTNIVDINEATNGVVVTYYFHNATPATVTLNDQVDADGDFFSFITNANFN